MTNPSSPPQFGEWMPIETAPKDAVIILGRDGMNPAAGKWRHGTWQVIQFEPDDWLTPYDFQTPTIWTPLPPRPCIPRR